MFLSVGIRASQRSLWDNSCLYWSGGINSAGCRSHRFPWRWPAPYAFVPRLQAFSVRLALDKTNLPARRVKPRSPRRSLRSPLNTVAKALGWLQIWFSPRFGQDGARALIVFRERARGDGEERTLPVLGWGSGLTASHLSLSALVFSLLPGLNKRAASEISGSDSRTNFV